MILFKLLSYSYARQYELPGSGHKCVTSTFNVFHMIRDDQISERCGWDAVIYLRFQRYLMLLTLGACILSCCVVLPINHMDDIGKFQYSHLNLVGEKRFNNAPM